MRWERVTNKAGKPETGLFRHSSTGDIYVRRKVKGRVVEKNTGEKTLGLAKAKAALIVSEEIQKRKNLRDSKSATFGEVGQYILRHYTPTLRQGTQDRQNGYIPRLIKVFGHLDVNEITEDHFVEWLGEFRKTQKRKTFSDYAKYMSLVMRFAYERKLATHRVTFRNPDAKKEEHGRYYTDSEIEALYRVMGEDTRDQVDLAFRCMMRLREILHLTWDRVNLEDGSIRLRAEDVKTGSKTGRGRIVYMGESVLARMKARRARMDSSSPYVFPSRDSDDRPADSNKTAWNHAKALAKIKGRARFHDLRHSGITRALFMAKADPIKVSQYAGVSVRIIERVYLHARPEFLRSVGDAVQ